MAKKPWYDWAFSGMQSFPLNRRGGFGGNIVHDAVDAGDVVDDLAGNLIQQLVGNAGPLGGHKIVGGHGPQGQSIVVGPAVAHDTHGAGVGQHGEILADALVLVSLLQGVAENGIRIIGEITRERLDLLREADAIAREELSRAGLDRDIWQCPVVLLADVHSVGVQGDERTYGSPIVLRPVSSEDAMTADWSRVPYDVLATISTRITNECRQINRVVLDCTSKPPATIEWE